MITKNSILVIKAGSFTESLFNTALLIRTLYCLHKATNNWRNGKNNWHLSKLNIRSLKVALNVTEFAITEVAFQLTREVLYPRVISDVVVRRAVFL